MAEFDKAWTFTAGWEGPWDGENMNPFKIDDNRASYGITPRFLKDYVGLKDSVQGKPYMRAIDRDRAKDIWYKTRWTWFKCEQIESDALAALIFDWAVRRPNHVAITLCNIVGLDTKEGVENPMMRNFGGNPDVKTSKMQLPSQKLIDILNAACKDENGVCTKESHWNFYLKVVAYRIVKEKPTLPGVVRRFACLLHGRFEVTASGFPSLPKAEQLKMTQAVTTIRDNPRAKAPKRKLTNENTEGGNSGWIWTGLGILCIGLAFSKKRKTSKKRR
jgi:Glycosyl hydrolase 108